MGMSNSHKGKRREQYMQAWPLGRQLEAMQDQINALSGALRASGVEFSDAEKFGKMQADFAAIRAKSSEPGES